MPKLPAHQVTTRNLGAAYPFIAEAGLGQRGVVIGDDLLGGSFVFDPFELYAAGVVSNPNMVVLPCVRSKKGTDQNPDLCLICRLRRERGVPERGTGSFSVTPAAPNM